MEILKLFEQKNIRNYVVCDELFLNNEVKDCKRIYDARSAAFYAFGESKIKNEDVVLIINGEYLSNIYTVLTEAWFQKTNLIIVAVYNSIYDIETHYLNRCLVSNIKFNDNDFELFKEKVEDSLEKIGPKLYSVVKNFDTPLNNYNEILEIIETKIEKGTEIYIYNADISKLHVNSLKVNNISAKYKYGIFSKYCAQLISCKKSILICDEDCLKVDSNIFLSQYVNEKFKVIIKVKEFENEFLDVLDKNKLVIIKTDNVNENIGDFINSNKPCVLLYKEG